MLFLLCLILPKEHQAAPQEQLLISQNQLELLSLLALPIVSLDLVLRLTAILILATLTYKPL